MLRPPRANGLRDKENQPEMPEREHAVAPLSRLWRSGRGEADPVAERVAAAASNRKSLKPKLKPNLISMMRRPPRTPPFPHPTLFRSARCFGPHAPTD